ncbi:MAG: hypothetical protein ACRDST_23005 [Pseudonocardiaceae bacterium]
MQQDGLLTSSQRVADDRVLRVYRITAAGRRMLFRAAGGGSRARR